MENRVKTKTINNQQVEVSKYQNLGKSGKSFINIEKINKVFDAIPRYESFIEDPSIASTSFFFNEKDSLIFDKTKKENNQFSRTRHFLKIPIGQGRTGSYAENDYFVEKYITNNIAKPSTLPNELILNYNTNYNEKNNINELLKFPEFVREKNKNKNFTEKKYNDSKDIFSSLEKEDMFSSKGQFGLMSNVDNPYFFEEYIKINEKYKNDRKDLIEAKGNYSNLESQQKKEKVIDIDLNSSGKGYALMFQNSIFTDIPNEDISSDPEDCFEFTNIQNAGNNIPSGISLKRNSGRLSDRKYYKYNSPFLIWNNLNKNWEYRGVLYPKYHMSTARFFDIGINPQFAISGSGNNVKIPKIIRQDSKITVGTSNSGFLAYFKNYFMERCCLTNTPSIIIKKNLGDDSFSNTSFPFLSLPTSQFGFPSHPKFHAYSENLISLKNYIKSPFVLSRTSFSTNVELICEFKNEEENSYYEEPINAVLNYFIVKQKKVDGDISLSSLDLKREWSPVSLNLNEKDQALYNSSQTLQSYLTSDSNSMGLHEGYYKPHITDSIRVNYTITTSQQDEAYLNSNIPIYRNTSTSIPNSPAISLPSQYLREIVNFGNYLFVAPSYKVLKNSQNNNDINTNNQKRFISLISQENFDNIKLIEYENHLNILDNNNLTTILDYSGSININSPCRVPSVCKNPVNSHLINFEFEIPAGNNISYKVGTNSLSSFTSSRSLKINKAFENNNPFIENSFKVSIPGSNDLREENNKYDYLFENITGLKYKNISQYVLYPEDEISICVSISPIIHPKPIKQILRIATAGKSNISLYGYYLHDNVKVYDENDVLKYYNSNNFPNVIVGNVHTDNVYSDNSFMNIRNYIDNIVTKNISFKNMTNPQRGLSTDQSIIKSGRTFNPYLPIYSDNYLNTSGQIIYDDAFLQYTTSSEEIENLNYYSENVFNNINYYKTYSYQPFEDSFNETIINRNLRVPKIYFSSKSYGQFANLIQQRQYTAMFDRKNNQKINVVTKEFINPDNGLSLTDLNNVVNINKSLTYELVNSRVNRFNVNDIENPDFQKIPYPYLTNKMVWRSDLSWSLEDILKSKHVAFTENV